MYVHTATDGRQVVALYPDLNGREPIISEDSVQSDDFSASN